MSKLLCTSIIAVALLTSASAAMANDKPLRDYSDQYGGYSPNSTEGQRAFWDEQSK